MALDQDANKEAACKQWIKAISGIQIQGDLFEELQSGEILCDIVNAVKPGSAKKAAIKTTKTAMGRNKANNNIANAKKASLQLGVAEHDAFETRDFISAGSDGRRRVVDVLAAWSVVFSEKHGKGKGYEFGAKRAKQNKRNFTQEQLNKSKSAVPIWNQGDRENKGAKGVDGYGIIKSEAKHNFGGKDLLTSKENKTSNIDGYGIIKSTDKHNFGGKDLLASKENKTSNIDGYGIIKTDAKHNYGGKDLLASKKTDTGGKLDSYGIIKSDAKSSYSAKDDKMASNKTKTGGDLDSYGIIKKSG